MSHNPQTCSSVTLSQNTSFAAGHGRQLIGRRFKFPAIAPTLIVECAALVFMLALLVSMGIEINHQDNMKMMWESPGDTREVAQIDVRVSHFSEVSPVWR